MEGLQEQSSQAERLVEYPPLSERGNIYLTREENLVGKVELNDFEWRGGMYVVPQTSFHEIWDDFFDGPPKQGQILTVGPYKLKVLHDPMEYWDPLSARYLFERQNGLLERIYYHGWRAARGIRKLWSRLILILNVWGMAHTPDGLIPTADDIYIVKKVKSWIKSIM